MPKVQAVSKKMRKWKIISTSQLHFSATVQMQSVYPLIIIVIHFKYVELNIQNSLGVNYHRFEQYYFKLTYCDVS
uniref:Uncharacterized protein n=1 Tax=Pararge aegeria TaxID=116150 RepID=S4P3V6_9NEOP